MTQASAATATTTVQQQRRLSAAEAVMVNSYRVTTVMERLANFLKSDQTDLVEFSSQCLSLSRGIDYALANNELPDSAKEIPAVLKQLCERNNALSTQAIVMVLLISVKNACKVGWFSEEERQEIFALANKLGSNFCSPGGDNAISSSHPAIATIMERFYPQMKMGHVLTAFEVKSGYGVYTNDFHILKKTACSPEDKIRLIVAQVDNLDTSACIISPKHVSFIINGRGVERRINISMDTGPQMPTNVTPLLKYGTNLLQAVGQFDGTYIIAAAFMYEMPLSDPPVLPDHEQSIGNGLESDPDLIEGPSRISLNCPISFNRIKLPVKGHKCKHLQCFDFSNFITINSRRPSWRCPHCNQCASYTDIRVDQNMVKVLKEVGDDVADVIISADGSWKAVLENDNRDQASDVNLDSLKEISEPQESADTPNALPGVVDLTEDDGAMDIDNVFEIEDTKPSVSDLCAPPNPNDLSEINQNIAAPIDDDFWVGLSDPSGLELPIFTGLQQSTPTSFVQPSYVVPTLTPEPFSLVNSTPTNFPFQQAQFMNSISSNEYGRFPAITRTVTRTPIAVQALPAQALGMQRIRPTVNSPTPSPTVVSQTNVSPTSNGFNAMYTDFETQQLFSRALRNPPQVMPVVSSASPQHRLGGPLQNQIRQDQPFTGQVPNVYRLNSLGEFQNSHLQQVFNPRLSQSLGQSTNAVRTSSPLPRTPVQQVAGAQQTRMASPVQRVVQIGRQNLAGPVQSQQSRTVSVLPGNSPRISPAAAQVDPRANGQADLTPEQNWQPAGRMRGSITGRDYSHFRDQMIQPTQQQSQPARPPSSVPVSTPMTISPQLHALIANHRTTHASQPHNDAAQG